MPKPPPEVPDPVEPEKPSMGLSPAVLAKRDFVKPDYWCPSTDVEYDPQCDPRNPKAIHYKDIVKAAETIKQTIPETPVVKSRCCAQFEMDLYYKMEIFHWTGSFHERGALYALTQLTKEQRCAGVYTASTGNWALALSYHGKKLNIPVVVVMPTETSESVVDKCKSYGANVVLFGNDLAEAKREAFVMISECRRGMYINGYDHPNVIEAAGCIGIEILDQIPKTEAILVPIGGGGLIAGIATAVKHFKPGVQIYGVEPEKCSCFFKAIDNEKLYKTVPSLSVAETLAIPLAGCNAFHTAQSLIDKMVLVHDDWITRAMLHLVEEEKIIPDGAGATSLAALMAMPEVLPELRDKTVVCVVTGSNVNLATLSIALERGLAIEGRMIKVIISLPCDNYGVYLKVHSIIANLGCNVLKCIKEHASLTENDFYTDFTTLICETRGLEHACTLKRVMNKLFPGMCDFYEEPFSPIPICACFPKKFPNL